MKVEDLIELLNNRLREFKLSQNYATMSGDLERVVAADKEIVALEDTLFKLSLLVDASQSAIVKEATLAQAMGDGSVAVLGEYDITSYATDPLHEEKIMNILSGMGTMDSAEQIDDYINGRYPSSPVTGEMVLSAAIAYAVDARLMMAIMEQDSRFGTAGVATRTLNPGNVGNDDDGNTRTYESWQEGVTAVAEWLSRHRGSTIMPEIPEETVSELSTDLEDSTGEPQSDSEQATSTVSAMTPTATTTTSSATSTPSGLTPAATTTTATTTSTTITSTTTPASIAPAPSLATTTPSVIPAEEPVPLVTSTSTTTPSTAGSTSSPQATSTPPTATTTPSVIPAEEPVPLVTSTSTTTTTSIDTAVDLIPSTDPTTSFDDDQDESPQATATQETATTTAN